MYGRRLFFVVLVVAGAVLPYLLADDAWLAKIETWVGSVAPSVVAKKEGLTGKPSAVTEQKLVNVSGQSSPTDHVPGYTVTSGSLPAWLSAAPMGNAEHPESAGSTANSGRSIELPRIVGPPGIRLEQLLSFDVTPEWIRSNWSRVTTRLPELDLQGWRVPVSRGSTQNGLAGSITYYFDRDRHVQRILLHGYTADASEVIQLATTRYSMQRVPSATTELYSATVQGQVIGGLRIDCSRIMSKANVSKHYQLLMELNRKATSYGMSREFERILNKAKLENRLLTPISAWPDAKTPPIDPRNRA